MVTTLESVPMAETAETVVTASSNRTNGTARQSLPTMDYSEIDRPGTYVVQQLGLLLRVPPDGLIAGRSPVIHLTGRARLVVSRLSGDPWLAIGKARSIAADHDFVVEF